MRQTLAINLTAFFYNLLLPIGGVGVAALRLQRFSARTSGRFTAALTAMICDRLVALAAVGIVGLFCWLVDPHPKPPGSLLMLLAGAAAIGAFWRRAPCRRACGSSSASFRRAAAVRGGRRRSCG